MTEFTIPVAFNVEAESEEAAAEQLVAELLRASLIDDYGQQRGTITCWWTPNHPEADGSDRGDPRLTWVPPRSPDEQ